MTVIVQKLVTDLHVRCSFPMRDDAIAASDTCQDRADTAVETPDGKFMYRCKGHRGLVRVERGPVWQTVPVREEAS